VRGASTGRRAENVLEVLNFFDLSSITVIKAGVSNPRLEYSAIVHNTRGDELEHVAIKHTCRWLG
jgi:hypothetical protein